MRPLAIAVLLCLLPAALPAESPSGARILGYYMVPEGTPFSIENFTDGNSQAYAIVSGGAVQAVVLSNLPFSESRVLSGKGEISEALRAYYYSLGYSPDAVLNFSAIHAGIVSVKGSREKGEARCRVLLGTDRNPCSDFDSCLRACYSVTSFCQQVALGAGRPFVEEIVAFEGNSRRISAAYSAEDAAYSAFSASNTNKTVAAYLSALGELNKAATAASQSPLFDGYSYCFMPDYSLPVITNLQLWAQTYYAQAAHFYNLDAEAALVLNRTMAGLARQSATASHPPKNSTANASPGTKAPALPALPAANATGHAASAILPASGTESLFLAFSALAVLSAMAFAAYFLARRKKPA